MLAVSYNQPKLCPNASWNPNATTFADKNTIGRYPTGTFINTNNTIYIPNRDEGYVVVWSEGSFTPTRNISINSTGVLGIYVTTIDDIYIDTFNSIGGVSKWTLNSTTTFPSVLKCIKCWGLFVDVSNTLYCSAVEDHQVVARSLDFTSSPVTTVAGTGISGATSNMLNKPRGIFVDINFDLYVADFLNHRIQLFQSGESNGITIAGDTSSVFTISLYRPTFIILDADKNFYIVDQGNHRIVGSGPSGFRCLVGCTDTHGAASNQLLWPQFFHFDSYGNMFVSDADNHRIQKFMLITNSCSKSNKYKNYF